MLKNRILFSFIILALIVFMSLYGGSESYIAFYTVLIVMAISFLSAFFTQQKFRFTHAFDKEICLKNDEVIYTLTIKNSLPFAYPSLRLFLHNSEGIQSDLDATPVFSIMPSSFLDFNIPIKCLYRGKSHIGVNRVVIYDMLGIFKFTKKVNDYSEIVVYPNIIEIRNVLLSNSNIPDIFTKKDINEEDNTTVSDIKQYQKEDGFKKIHWKLTARRNEFMVKVFQTMGYENTILLLDSQSISAKNAVKVSLEDKLIEAAVSLSNHVLKKNFPLEICWHDEGIASYKKTAYAEFQDIYNRLAQMEFNQASSYSQLIDNTTAFIKEKTDMIFISADINPEVVELLKNLSVYGHNIILIWISQTDKNSALAQKVEETIANLFESNVQVFYVPPDADIKTILN